MDALKNKDMPKNARYQKKSKFKTFFAAMKEVLNDPDTVILTDQELVVLVNDRLKSEDRISKKTWEEWLNKKSPRGVENQKGITDEEAKEFRHTLAAARVKQKMDLTKKSLDPNNQAAYKQHWILQRKFDDLRDKPQIQLNSNPTISIEAGNSEQKKLIEGILAGKTIDIDHEEVGPERLEEDNG
jgi:hypothetical protein